MPDTQRDLTSLQALLADNTSGAISPQDLRDFLVSALGGYGSISVVNGVTAQTTIGTSDVKVNQFTTNGASDGSNVVPDHTNDQLTVGVAGDYLIEATISAEGTAGVRFDFRVYVNGAAVAIQASAKFDAAGAMLNVKLSGIVAISAAQTVDVRVQVDSGSNRTLLVKGANLLVKRMK